MSIAIARQAARQVFKEAQLSLPVDLEELAQWRGLVIEPAANSRMVRVDQDSTLTCEESGAQGVPPAGRRFDD